MASVGPVDSTQGNQPVAPVPPQQPEKAEDSGGSEFETLMRSLVAPDGENKVNEEEFFAGLVKERVAKLKGEEAGTEYSEALERNKAALRQADGYISFEDAAKAALRELRSSGTLSAEETDEIYTEAFDAAQLDGNKDALYDGRGGEGDPTIALELMETALLAARAILDGFDNGTEPSKMRSVDEASNGKAAVVGPAGPAGGAGPIAPLGDASAIPDVVEPEGTTVDGANGFLFKPVSDNEGKLAVLMPEVLAYQVESVVLKDVGGNVLDEGRSTGYGDTGEREKFAFTKEGGEYPEDLTVEVRLFDGSTKTYKIADPSQRYD